MYLDASMFILIPGILLSLYAQSAVNSAYSKYSGIGNIKGYTGAEIAQMILQGAGITNMPIEPIAGELTDHYDPKAKVLRLSEGVYNSTSIAAAGIAAHECGHAIQDARNYVPMRLRSGLVPLASVGGNLGMMIAIAGAMVRNATMMRIGVILFSAAVLFTIVTLPVEYNASDRALEILNKGILNPSELQGARKVLRAAGLTYVAAALSSVLSLLRVLYIGRRRND